MDCASPGLVTLNCPEGLGDQADRPALIRSQAVITGGSLNRILSRGTINDIEIHGSRRPP